MICNWLPKLNKQTNKQDNTIDHCQPVCAIEQICTKYSQKSFEIKQMTATDTYVDE